jgi:alkaline phosphatase D
VTCRGRNPHLRFHSNRRGYTKLTSHPDRMEALFRSLSYVSRPGAPLEDRGHFVTLAGRPGVVPA